MAKIKNENGKNKKTKEAKIKNEKGKKAKKNEKGIGADKL
jgi:hypothetical protein